MDRAAHIGALAGTRLAVDIGSTVVKIARVGPDARMLVQEFHPRDFEAGIARQVRALLDSNEAAMQGGEPLVCSSANGGLRVGVVSLSSHYSGAVLRDQVLLAGANPVFVRTMDEHGGDVRYVDMLFVAGGIDCDDAAPLAQRIERFEPDAYRYGALVYAGNAALAPRFVERFPSARAISNPLADGLSSRTHSVFDAVRRAYLDDLIYKEGVSELAEGLSQGIRPTPEVVNRGFHRAVVNASSIPVATPCLLLDIGGATTDIHYTVELVPDDSEEQPMGGSSVARYVFTDLGIVASRDSLMLQLRTHPRLYALLEVITDGDVREAYRLMREGELVPTPQVLSYACLFLALERFMLGRGPGLPAADLRKLAQIMLTGGAAQALDPTTVGAVLMLLLDEPHHTPEVYIDTQYQIWVDGITWAEHMPT